MTWLLREYDVISYGYMRIYVRWWKTVVERWITTNTRAYVHIHRWHAYMARTMRYRIASATLTYDKGKRANH